MKCTRCMTCSSTIDEHVNARLGANPLTLVLVVVIVLALLHPLIFIIRVSIPVLHR